MTNLTPSEARRLIDKLHHNQTKEHGISILEEKYLAALEIALPVLEQQEKGEAEWICWDGEMALPPVGNDVVVEARMRSGDSICAAAKTFRWRNYVQQSNDIVAYRVVKSGGATQPTKDTYQQIENNGSEG